MGRVDPAALTAFVLAAEKEPSKTPFYIAGAVLAAWAVVVAVIGISQPDFPGSAMRSRLVMGLSVVLVLTAVTTAVVTAGTPAKGQRTLYAGTRETPFMFPLWQTGWPPRNRQGVGRSGTLRTIFSSEICPIER